MDLRTAVIVKKDAQSPLVKDVDDDDEKKSAPVKQEVTLNFRKSNFVGRKEELKFLHNVYEHLPTAPPTLPDVTLIHGESGTGKSALMLEFINSLNRRLQIDHHMDTNDHTQHPARGEASGGIYCMSGKFFQGNHSRPFSAIIDSVSTFASVVLRKRPWEFGRILSDMKERLGPNEIHFLFIFMPKLVSLCLAFKSQNNTGSGNDDDGESDVSNDHILSRGSLFQSQPQYESFSLRDKLLEMDDTNQPNIWNRLKYIIFVFFQIIIATDRPLVMFLDDLQWADNESLDLIITILRDKSSHNLVFLGVHRDSIHDVTTTKGGNKFIQRWGSCCSHVRKLQKLSLGQLCVEDTNVFLSKLLQLDLSETKSISELLHTRSKGNAFYLKYLLAELNRQKYIRYDTKLSKWVWEKCHLNDWSHVFMNDNDAVMAEIRRFPHEFQMVIKVATYTVNNLSKKNFLDLLDCLQECNVTEQDLDHILDEAVAQSLFVYDDFSGTYHFSHDKVCQAGTALIVSGTDNMKIREQIGICLYKLHNSSSSTDDWMMDVAATNLNACNSMALGVVHMVTINLDTGMKYLRIAAFDKALTFLKASFKYLKMIDLHWDDEYNLSLSVFRALTDTYFYLDDKEGGEKCAKELLRNAKCTEDRGQTHLTLALYWARKDYQIQCFDMTLKAVKELNLFPDDNPLILASIALKKMKSWYLTHNDDSVLGLPDAPKDEARLYVMRCFLQGVITAGFLGKDEYTLLFGFYGIQACFEIGLCAEASTFMINFAHTVMIKFNDFSLAMQFADLALKIVERLPKKDVAAVTYFGLAGYIFAWKWNTENLILLCQKGYRCGMESGSLQFAFMNRYALNRLIRGNGYPLGLVADAIDETIRHLGLFQVDSLLIQNDELRLNVYIFMGKLDLDWEDLRSFGPQEEVDIDTHRLFIGYSIRAQLGIYFGEYEFAQEMAKKLKQLPIVDDFASRMKVREMEHLFVTLIYLTGLAHQTGDKKYKVLAKQHAKFVKKQMKNRKHCYGGEALKLLVKVELLALKKFVVCGKLEKLYKQAAIAALDDGFTHYAALALEMGGEKLLKRGKTELCCAFFTDARSCYEEWGAMAKVAHIDDKWSGHLRSKGDITKNVIPGLRAIFAKNRAVRKPELILFDLSQVPDLVVNNTSSPSV